MHILDGGCSVAMETGGWSCYYLKAPAEEMSTTPETRAGHPPAVKAGGKRIVRKNNNSGDSHTQEKENKKLENSLHKPVLIISRALARGDKDFPPPAAQVAHQKPHPATEKLPSCYHIKQHIQQPRK
ncbi:death-associated protein 1-like [Mixophyes fleayi]|uniref:death-associated protein 1-like n=1 Tax=Mixophyes fleayi TaxID=3061075 RepID=UPI003F4DD4DD